ncbi:hypothetical protein ACTQ32_13190 [Roseburia faecis]|uniref:hypothetical protein n=1 Tax=Roseburia faecis TaxID=301302 RepID=UPI003F9A8E3E
MKFFSEGFTSRSYFNICKQIVCGSYKEQVEKYNFSFNFSDENEMNAWTSLLDNGSDYLVVNVGTLIELFSLTKTTFGQKDCFESIGIAKNENNSGVKGFFDEKNCNLYFTGTPKDSVRERASTCAALFAFRFIGTHELGHILNGHTSYLKKMYMNSKIGMRNEKITRCDAYCLDRRTLEMDADAAAATASIDNVIMLYHNEFDEFLSTLFKKKEEIFGLWSFAICSVFMLFESLMTTTYNKNGYYLPNKARFYMAMGSAYETAKEYVNYDIVPELKENKAMIVKEVFYGIEQAEKIFLKKGFAFSWIKDFFEESELYIEYSDEVLCNWDNNLENKLEKYARTPLYNKDKMGAVFEQLKRIHDSGRL